MCLERPTGKRVRVGVTRLITTFVNVIPTTIAVLI